MNDHSDRRRNVLLKARLDPSDFIDSMRNSQSHTIFAITLHTDSTTNTCPSALSHLFVAPPLAENCQEETYVGNVLD